MAEKYPKGFKRGGHTQIAVRFPDKVFREIITRAKREKRTFNEMVLELCACGEICLADSDRHEAA
jgi:hypothetical protein